MEETPFPELKILKADFLQDVEGRQMCPKCGKSRKYYCYNCFVPVPAIKDKVPKLKLPVKIDIIKHPNEVDGKSTAAHAAVLAPDDVTVYTYPCIPDYAEKDKVLLVFPCEESLTLEKYKNTYCDSEEVLYSKEVEITEPSIPMKRGVPEKQACDEPLSKKPCTDTRKSNCNIPETITNLNCSSNQSAEDEILLSTSHTSIAENTLKFKCPFSRVVFIDSTWYQVKKIYTDERLEGLQRIELKTQKTKFWRHQKDKPDTYLSTIEAIYYFLCEFHEHFIDKHYIGQYDNLLFFFCFMYKKIRHLYEGGKKLKAYST